MFPWPSSTFFFKKNCSWPIDAIAHNALGSWYFLQKMAERQIKSGMVTGCKIRQRQIFEHKVALNPIYRICLNFAKHCVSSCYQNSIIGQKFTVPFLKYKHLKLKLKVFSAGCSVAVVTYCVTKIIPRCSPMIGQFFDTWL